MIDTVSKLPFWLSGVEAGRLTQAAEVFWARVETWLNEAAAQADIATCTSKALEYHARDRAIVRLPGEPEPLWRQRVLHALLAALRSGSRIGLEEILAAHGLQNFTVTERDPAWDWDVILIELDPTQLTLDSDSLNRVLYAWGRLCRRYVPTYTMAASAAIAPFQDRGTFYFGSAS